MIRRLKKKKLKDRSRGKEKERGNERENILQYNNHTPYTTGCYKRSVVYTTEKKWTVIYLRMYYEKIYIYTKRNTIVVKARS